jgi:hypothetical protein
MTSGMLISEEEVKQSADDAFEGEWIGTPPLLSEEEKDRGVATVRGAAKDQSIALSVLHHRELAPTLQPIGVEKKMRLVLDGFPFDLEGTIDVEEPRVIRDRKTSAKSPSGNEIEGNPQGEAYALMLSKTEDRPPKPFVMDYLVKTTKPKVVTIGPWAPANYVAIVKRFEAAAHVLESGAFYPVDPTGPSGWVCQPKWCGYFDICPFGRARRTQVQVNP